VGASTLARRAVGAARRRAKGISYRRTPSFTRPISQACSYDQVTSPRYREWCERMHLPALTHRKLWEWCYILQVLDVAGMVRSGRRGLGFGVGTEPITALLAAGGCRVLATDLPSSVDESQGWIATGQHAERVADVNRWEVCPDEVIRDAVEFRDVDMRAIPPDLRGYDFAWSSCAMEHLGDLERGLQFFEQHLECLKPGGVGVHTTEFNTASNDSTLADGHTVLYRRRDLEALALRMRSLGHTMRITFALPTRPEDLHIDLKPYTDLHIRTETEGHIHTSFGLVVRKKR
jgi:hypothetical protein